MVCISANLKRVEASPPNSLLRCRLRLNGRRKDAVNPNKTFKFRIAGAGRQWLPGVRVCDCRPALAGSGRPVGVASVSAAGGRAGPVGLVDGRLRSPPGIPAPARSPVRVGQLGQRLRPGLEGGRRALGLGGSPCGGPGPPLFNQARPPTRRSPLGHCTVWRRRKPALTPSQPLEPARRPGPMSDSRRPRPARPPAPIRPTGRIRAGSCRSDSDRSKSDRSESDRCESDRGLTGRRDPSWARARGGGRACAAATRPALRAVAPTARCLTD